MRSVLLTITAVVIVLFVTTSTAFGDVAPTGVSYLLYENWGGAWVDAEKSPSNPEDDNMCWAAAASNVLDWTGWGLVNGMTGTDDMFAYFQDHWTDKGGMMNHGWQWWMTGYNPSDRWPGWSHVDVAGGGFYPSQNYTSLYHYTTNTRTALPSLDSYLRAGYGTALALYGSGGHAVTAWGLTHADDNPSDYTGIYLTDSDDYRSNPNPPDRLRYYEIEKSGGKWYLQNYLGSNKWYIGGVYGLEANPDHIINGDFDGDKEVDASDIDMLAAEIRGAANTQTYDLTGDGLIDLADLDKLVCDILGTQYGDANLNGIVDFDDFTLMASSFGQAASWQNGDFDGNGMNNLADFGLLNYNYGKNHAVLTPGASTPEPSTSLLIALLAPVMLRRKSRQSRRKAA